MTRLTIAVLVLGSLLLQSCGNDEEHVEPVPGIAFPVSDEALGGEALIEGRLSVRDGCLILTDTGSDAYLLIWPDWLRLARDSSGVAVTDAAGMVLARVGDEVSIGGGEIAGDPRDLSKIPPSCLSMKSWGVGGSEHEVSITRLS